MEDINIHITRLNIKLQQLVKQYNSLLVSCDRQKENLLALQQKNESQKDAIALLQQQQLILKASIGNMDEKEKKALEQKINGYLRSIDKCIALLSHNS